ncbi:MlaD family protein [Nocardioides sp. TRM66260-LWL]|uniref:MlaD family protein n=1 Tax=Nocardioides sp. TRM66260-LWL TaxID=2874478 RepID=UPI001CC7201F|nr:MlaD family protein [Nocardioides sp. TRM66260-LWL]MBZ5735311.1 MlaD family protein [Nocardioides sp. TRM66260-LWL]
MKIRFLTPLRAIAAATALALVVGVLLLRGGSADDDVVYGSFADASPLDVGSEVRASGVRVGSVASIELDGKVARVGLRLDPEVLPLHQDASMAIRPINLLGENFVNLDPGTADAPVLRGPLPASQTSTDVTLQAVLDTFDDPTSTGLAALVSELGAGVDGRGSEIAGALTALGPTMQQISRLGDLLRGQNDVLRRLIDNADPVAAAVSGKDGRRLDGLIREATRTLHALAAQRSGLEATVAELPSTLAQAQRTLGNLDRVSRSTTPVLRRARPVTQDLDQISREISDFTVQATPAFASFDRLFKAADQLLREAAPITRTLREHGPQLRRSSRNLDPATEQVLDRHLGDLMAFVRKWSLSTNGRDGISHYFRGVFHVTPESLNSLLGADVLPSIVKASPGDGNSTPDQVLPSVPQIDLGGVLPGVTGSVSGLLGGLLGGGSGGASSGGKGSASPGVSPSKGSQGLLGGLLGQRRSATERRSRVAQQDDRTSATGLTADQEQSLLNQLLGSTGGTR